MPKVSIGVPVFNGGPFLPAVLTSLANQTFADVEIIVSDNASTDETQEVCERFSEADSRIRYYRQPENIGAAANFEFVLRHAGGEYFIWAAADDVALPQMVEVLADTLDQHPAVALATGDIKDVDLRTNVVTIRELASIRLGKAISHPGTNTELFFRNPTSNIFFAIYGLYRTSDVRTASLNYKGLVRYASGSEIPILAQVALRGLIVSVPKVLKIYQRHQDSVFHREQTRMDGKFWFPYAQQLNISSVLLSLVLFKPLPLSLRLRLLAVVLCDGFKIPLRLGYHIGRAATRPYRRKT